VFEPIFRYLEEALDRHADTLLGELVNIDFTYFVILKVLYKRNQVSKLSC
jgi:hypothetical protein